jgi:hypothetical protein
MDEASRRLLATIKYALENESSRAAAGCWTACLMALAHQDATAATAWLAQFIGDELADVGTAESARSEEERSGDAGAAVPTQIGA